MKAEFEEHGYYVLRGLLTQAEVDRLAGPICDAFVAGTKDSATPADIQYPQGGVYSMGPRILEAHPEIVEVSLAHPAIVGAVEALFGEPATLAQYWSIMRPPGAEVGDEPFVHGSLAHMDYKPWRCVGSFVKWVFAIIPFVDYTESAGPLCVSPGSHSKSRVLPSDGRVHQVDAAQVPAAAETGLVDPELRKGDVVLMHGFTWHEPRPNCGDTDRCGLYMKFHAKSSPPACGPWIYPTAVHDRLSDSMQHLVPYHRGDGQYAAMRENPVDGVDEARLLVEDSGGRVLVLGDGEDGWALPRYVLDESDSGHILDCCNVMGPVLTRARRQLGLALPWLSWIADQTDSAPEGRAGEWRSRIYGHRLADAEPELECSTVHQWMTAEALDAAIAAGQLACGEAAKKWLHMWQAEEDEDGRRVARSYGFPLSDQQYYKYNSVGNPPGHYRIGVFDSDGRPPAPPPKVDAT